MKINKNLKKKFLRRTIMVPIILSKCSFISEAAVKVISDQPWLLGPRTQERGKKTKPLIGQSLHHNTDHRHKLLQSSLHQRLSCQCPFLFNKMNKQKKKNRIFPQTSSPEGIFSSSKNLSHNIIDTQTLHRIGI